MNLEQAYFLPHLQASIEVMRTNLPTRTAMRAPGVVQASLVMESIIDTVARAANLDPELVRQVRMTTQSLLSRYHSNIVSRD